MIDSLDSLAIRRMCVLMECFYFSAKFDFN